MSGRAARADGRLVRRRIMSLGPMLALTYATGIVDAVGYLHLDQVFAGNMTGNVVILGMAAVNGTELRVLGPAVALACFLLGAAAAGRALRTAAPGWSDRCTALLCGVGLALAVAAAGLSIIGADTTPELRASMAAILALAMGAQAATARHVAVKDITTVVVTSTLTGLAADSRLGAGRKQGAARRSAAVAFIILGAVAGALLSQEHVGLAVSAAALVVLAATGLGHASTRSSEFGASGPNSPSSSSSATVPTRGRS